MLPFGLGSALRHFYRGSVRHFRAAYAALVPPVPAARRRSPSRRHTPGPGSPGAGCASWPRARARTWSSPSSILGAQLTGHLRARGLLPVPSVVLVIDFAVHRQWLHPGNDHHLCLTEQAAREVRESTGAPAWTCGPVVAPGFFADAPDARRADVSDAPGAAGWRGLFDRLGPGRPAVVLSAGAVGRWARTWTSPSGSLTDRGFLPVVLCGDNERLRRDLSNTPGVVTLGWVTDMPGLLQAARALVDNAAGQNRRTGAGRRAAGRGIPPDVRDTARTVSGGWPRWACRTSPRTGPSCSARCGGSPPRGRPGGSGIVAGRALFTDDAVARACALADAGHRR